MRILSLAIVLLARLGLAAPAASSSEASSIHVRFELLNEPSEMALTIVDAASNEVLGRACSTKLDSGKFTNWPVSIALDTSGRGTGNITLGTTTQPMVYNADPAASLSCDKIFNEKAIFISCKAVVPADIEFASTEDRKAVECISNAAASLAAVADAMNEAGNADGPAPHSFTDELNGGSNSTEIETTNGKRQTNPCSQWTPDTRRVGDGDPWRHNLHTQISLPANCGGAQSCSASYNENRGWSFTANLGGSSGWISGGFSVSYTQSSGNSYTCGGGRGETVCVWYNQAFTEYNVVSGSRNGCGQFSPSRYTKISSPNTNNSGGSVYCVSGGNCRNKGDRYWQLYTHHGPP